MKFENLTEEQIRLIQHLVEVQNSGKYKSEFISYVNRRGCFILASPKNEEDNKYTLQVNETDILYLAETGYITLIKSWENRSNGPRELIGDQVHYKLSLKPTAYGQRLFVSEKLLSEKTNSISQESYTESFYIDLNRIEQLRALSHSKFDLTKLIRLCEELNLCYKNESYIAVAALSRALTDHIPPVFECKSFSEVANNYSGSGRTFKETMEHLDNSLRKIANANLHSQIRSKEVLPTKTQVNFSNSLDVLLAEVIRTLL